MVLYRSAMIKTISPITVRDAPLSIGARIVGVLPIWAVVKTCRVSPFSSCGGSFTYSHSGNDEPASGDNAGGLFVISRASDTCFYFHGFSLSVTLILVLRTMVFSVSMVRVTGILSADVDGVSQWVGSSLFSSGSCLSSCRVNPGLDEEKSSFIFSPSTRFPDSFRTVCIPYWSLSPCHSHDNISPSVSRASHLKVTLSSAIPVFHFASSSCPGTLIINLFGSLKLWLVFRWTFSWVRSRSTLSIYCRPHMRLNQLRYFLCVPCVTVTRSNSAARTARPLQ